MSDIASVPAHLRPALAAAVALELEYATDSEWPAVSDAEAYASRRAEVVSAFRLADNWDAECCSPEQVVRLARRAASEARPFDLTAWPDTVELATDWLARITSARDLIQLADALEDPCAD